MNIKMDNINYQTFNEDKAGLELNLRRSRSNIDELRAEQERLMIEEQNRLVHARTLMIAGQLNNNTP
jgi:hypothetical protein